MPASPRSLHTHALYYPLAPPSGPPYTSRLPPVMRRLTTTATSLYGLPTPRSSIDVSKLANTLSSSHATQKLEFVVLMVAVILLLFLVVVISFKCRRCFARERMLSQSPAAPKLRSESARPRIIARCLETGDSNSLPNHLPRDIIRAFCTAPSPSLSPRTSLQEFPISNPEMSSENPSPSPSPAPSYHSNGFLPVRSASPMDPHGQVHILERRSWDFKCKGPRDSQTNDSDSPEALAANEAKDHEVQQLKSNSESELRTSTTEEKRRSDSGALAPEGVVTVKSALCDHIKCTGGDGISQEIGRLDALQKLASPILLGPSWDDARDTSANEEGNTLDLLLGVEAINRSSKAEGSENQLAEGTRESERPLKDSQEAVQFEEAKASMKATAADPPCPNESAGGPNKEGDDTMSDPSVAVKRSDTPATSHREPRSNGKDDRVHQSDDSRATHSSNKAKLILSTPSHRTICPTYSNLKVKYSLSGSCSPMLALNGNILPQPADHSNLNRGAQPLEGVITLSDGKASAGMKTNASLESTTPVQQEIGSTDVNGDSDAVD